MNSASTSRCGDSFSTTPATSPRGDFGVSLATQQKVLTEFLTLFPATLELSFFAMLFAIVIGLPAGAVAAVRRGGVFDQALMTVSLFGYSMPIFWWGLVLIMFFSVTLGVLPVSGRIDLINYSFDQPTGFMLIDAALSDQPGAVVDALKHLVLPAIVLGTVPLAVDRAHDALVDARSVERGLCAHRPRQGAVAVSRRRRARAAQRAAAGASR